MNQHDFDILLQKYLSGECTPEEEREIVAWSEHTAENARPGLDAAEQRFLERRIWGKIRKATLGNSFRLDVSFVQYTRIAATIALVIGIGAYMYLREARKAEPLIAAAQQRNTIIDLPEDWIEMRNNAASDEELVSLEDGTIVTLARNSKIRFPRHFEPKTREVQLEGEAVFKVKRDINRPFFVYSGELVTQVLGTSFKIRSFENAKTIEVQVLTGRVSVYENAQKSPQARNGVILKPNQKITFDRESKKLVPDLVEVPAIVEPPADKQEFAFEEATLAQVLDVIRKAYEVEIVVANPALNDCTFTGDISGLPLHTQLRFICKSVNASYELRGTTLFIYNPLTP